MKSVFSNKLFSSVIPFTDYFSQSINKLARTAVAAMAAGLISVSAQAAEPLKIGYSDWPGWVAWEVAIEKDWFSAEIRKILNYRSPRTVLVCDLGGVFFC